MIPGTKISGLRYVAAGDVVTGNGLEVIEKALRYGIDLPNPSHSYDVQCLSCIVDGYVSALASTVNRCIDWLVEHYPREFEHDPNT